MNKQHSVYCANCGTRLTIKRRAMPKFGRIIDIVEYHVCPDEPVEIDLKPIDVPVFKEKEGKNKFVQNLNELQPPTHFSEGSNMRNLPIVDKRPKEAIKSMAPQNLLNQMKHLQNIPPAHDLDDSDIEESN